MLCQDTLAPVPQEPFANDPSAQDVWYPPGHGDVYSALHQSGLLENLINQVDS
jgi:UTP--glucose-1-phosphate uridylyltransferase